jgi:flagellar protein FlaG
MTISINELSNVHTFKRDGAKVDANLQPAQQSKAPVETKPAAGVEGSAELATKIASLPQMVRRNLKFEIDRNTGAQVISVIDSDTNELIRQIPPAQILRIIQQVQEMQGRMMPGMFLDDHT